MAKAVPILESSGWKLIGGFVQHTGRLYTVIDTWEIRDFNHFEEGLGVLLTHPYFVEFQKVLDEAVTKETVVMLSAVPYFSGASA